MASRATRLRKGAPKSGDGEQLSQLLPVPNTIGAIAKSTALGQSIKTNKLNNRILKPAVIKTAKVKRNKYGTGPFDENWLNLDCCGLFCASLTYMLHLYGVYEVCLVLIPPWMSTVDEDGVRTISPMGHLHRSMFTLVAALAVYAHFKAMTTNPGAVPPDAIQIEEMMELTKQQQQSEDNAAANGDTTSSLMVEDLPPKPPLRKGRRLCRRCNTFKPKRAHHCSICKRCIIKMDHHCPWVNNCVGIGNHKYFLLFIFYTCLSCIYSLTLLFWRVVDCTSHHGHVRTHHITCLDKPSQLLGMLGLLIEAILFGMFTSCMMCDQSGVVLTKITNIDRLKMGAAEAVDGSVESLAGVVEVFGVINPSKKQLDLGGGFRADWLSPFHRIRFPDSLHDEIMGFCKPCTTRMCGGSGHATANDETEMSPMMRNVANIV